MNDIINHVKEAVNSVEEGYYSLKDVAQIDGELESQSQKKKTLENRFMIRFSTKYSKLFDNNPQIYRGLEEDFEIPKKYMYSDIADNEIRKTWESLHEKETMTSSKDQIMFNYFTTIPDFVIHKDQLDQSEEGQKLIIECKTSFSSNNVEMLKDIFHINIYSEKYNFQNNVLLLANIKKDDWMEVLAEYKTQNYYKAKTDSLGRIYVIFKESYNKDCEVFLFSTLLYGIV